MTGALRRLPAASVCSMLLGAARRTLPATVVAASVEHMARRGAGLASLQASRVCSLSTAAARSLATTPDRGWMSLHASVERRMMSSTAPEKSAASDGSDLDPYLPHRVNFENAKAYIKANVAKGMSHEEVAVIVKKAMELHIPPVPSLEELQEQERTSEKELKEQRLKHDLERANQEAMRRIPSIDALGRAYATGYRKTATARVWVSKGTGRVTVNRVMMVDYFKRITLRDEIYRPLQVVGGALAYDVWATVSGGGLSAQAGAIRLGVARALQAFHKEHRAILKEQRLLTQDDRKVERKKPGQPKARKHFQWVKR